MATTPNFGMPILTTADTAKLDTLFNAMTSALDTNLKTAVDALRGYRTDLDEAGRNSLAGADLFEGLRVRTTDTKRDWLYTGTAWVTADNGLYLITPTAANMLNASATADGTISLSGAAGAWCEMRNVFSSRFRNYLILYTLSGSALSAGVMRLMSGSAQDTTASYGNARAYITSGGAYTPAYNSGETSGRLIAVNTSGAMSGKLALSDPADGANNTTGIWDTMGGGLPSNGGINAAATVHNGIAFQRNAGTTGGYVKIYGYA